jgi:hypothetical protein
MDVKRRITAEIQPTASEYLRRKNRKKQLANVSFGVKGWGTDLIDLGRLNL